MIVENPETRPLPVKWDHVPVEWSAWEHFAIFICPPPKPEPCRGCGLIAPMSHSDGIREGKLTGMTYKKFQREPTRCLHARRCTTCGFTEVYDGEQLWVLDDSDYTVFGSVAR